MSPGDQTTLASGPQVTLQEKSLKFDIVDYTLNYSELTIKT
jgi:hypothetical protein